MTYAAEDIPVPFSNTAEIITILDENCRIRFQSPAFYKATGFEPEEVEGMHLESFIHPDDWPLLYTILDLSSGGSKTQKYVSIRYRKKQGGYWQAQVSTTSLPGEQSPKGSVLIATAANTPDNSPVPDAQLLTVLANYQDKAIVITDREGKITWINAGFTHITGFTAEEVIGRTPGSFLQGPLTNPDTITYMHDCLQAGEGFTVEAINYRKDKSNFWMSVEVTPVYNDSGQLTHFVGIEADITERKRLQEQLVQHFSVLDAVQESIQAGIFALDDQFRYLSFNSSHRQSMQRLFGAEIREGVNMMEMLDARVNTGQVQSRLRRAMKGEQFTVQSELMVSPDEKRVFEISYNPIKTPDNQIKGVAVLVHEITSRIEAEREQDRTVHELLNYKQVLDKSTLVSVMDPSGKIIHVNNLFCTITKFSPDELIGQDYWSLYRGHHPDSFIDTIRQTISQGQLWRGEIRSRAKDGSYYWVELVINPVLSADGEITEYIALHNDITDRKLWEEQIRRSEATLRVAQEVGKIGNWEFNPKSNQMTWSDEVFRIHGLDPVQGVPSLEEMKALFRSDDWPECYRVAMDSVEQGKTFNRDYAIVLPDGTDKHINIISQPEFDRKGKVKRVFGIVMDITDRKKAEKHLQQQNDELQKINAQLDHFVYSVSHDLKAPLASVLGLIALAEMDEDPASRSEYLKLMRKSVHRLDKFILDIIDFSRNSRTEITKERVNLNTRIGEIRRELAHAPDSERINWIVEIKEEARFYTDATRLSIVLNNLLSNAIRYSDPRKANPFVQINAQVTPQKASIVISDNGIGIENQHLDKIFNMFYRATERKAGSGLGLFIVKETITTLGGSITVTSESGKGTTFTIELPNRLK